MNLGLTLGSKQLDLAETVQNTLLLLRDLSSRWSTTATARGVAQRATMPHPSEDVRALGPGLGRLEERRVRLNVRQRLLVVGPHCVRRQEGPACEEGVH